MTFRNHGRTLPDNVVAFPRARRARSQRQSFAYDPVQWAPHKQAAPTSGAALNARLMVLLGICVTGAAIVISAAHFLQG